jgi:hypothetical protein
MTDLYFFLATLALTLLGFASFRLFFNPGTPSMNTFKKSGTAEQVTKYLAQWDATGLAKARSNLRFDYLFILIYATMWIAAARYFEPRVGIAANVFAAIGLLGAVFDLIENQCLAKMLNGNATDEIAKRCKRVMQIQFTLFGIAALCFLVIAPIVAARG